MTVFFALLANIQQANAIPSPGARAYKLQGAWASAPTLASINPEDGKATAAFFGETSADDLLVFDLKVGNAVVGQQCVYIDNNSEALNPQHQTLFVPLNSKKEWEAFRDAGALGVTITNGCESTVPAKVCATDNTIYTTGKDRLGAAHTYSGGQTFVNGVPTKTIKMVCNGGTATSCPTWVEDQNAAVGNCTPLNSCAAQIVTWSSNGTNCSAAVSESIHGSTTTLSNSARGSIGQVDMVCNDGHWLMGGSTVMVGPAGNQTSYDVPGSLTCNPSGTCGAATSVASRTSPTTGLCDVGAPSGVTFNKGSWAWTCTRGLSTASCSAPFMADGQCGNANGGSFASEPSSNMCASGNFSGASRDGNGWSWSCNGNNGGNSASCHASMNAPPPECGSGSNTLPGGVSIQSVVTSCPRPVFMSNPVSTFCNSGELSGFPSGLNQMNFQWVYMWSCWSPGQGVTCWRSAC